MRFQFEQFFSIGVGIALQLPTRQLVSRLTEVREYHAEVRNLEWTLEKQAKITTKGQITLPLAIRRALGVRPGDMLRFEVDKTGIWLRPAKAKSPFAKYRGIGNRGIGSGKKAINRWIREMRGR